MSGLLETHEMSANIYSEEYNNEQFELNEMEDDYDSNSFKANKRYNSSKTP